VTRALQSAALRSRIVIIAALLLATAAVAGVGAIALFGGSGEGISSAPTTITNPTTTVMVTTTIGSTTITNPSTTAPTTTLPPRVTLETAVDTSPRLMATVTALYVWMVDPDAELPHISEGLAAHLESARNGVTLHLTAVVHRDVLADGVRVAVVEVADDVLLLVAEGSRWEIVGAKLTSFDMGPWYGEPIRHILVIGTDARPHQSQPAFRADSIHIVAASLGDRGGAVVGFPRDTYVAASYGSDKFSSVNVRGSTDEMVEIAEDLSGIDLEGYILTGFAGFKHLINSFGGVEVDVPFRMADDSSNAFLDAGLQVLKGGDALAFSRNRHISGGDFTRSRHQGIVIEAGLTGAQGMGIGKLPKLLRLLSADTWTDLSAAQLLQLGAIAYELDPAAVGNAVLPGSVGTTNGASVVYLSPDADAVFEDLIDGVVGDD